MSLSAPPTCRYPGCTEPVAERAGTVGAHPAYCPAPDHHPASAYRARQRERAELAGHPIPEPSDRPVTQARLRAASLRDEVLTAVVVAQERLSQLLEDLRTLGDPDAAAAEMASVAATAEQEVGRAHGLVADAEAQRRAAEMAREEHERASAEMADQADRAEARARAISEDAEMRVRDAESSAQASATRAADAERLAQRVQREADQAVAAAQDRARREQEGARQRVAEAETELARVRALAEGEIRAARDTATEAHAETAAVRKEAAAQLADERRRADQARDAAEKRVLQVEARADVAVRDARADAQARTDAAAAQVALLIAERERMVSQLDAERAAFRAALTASEQLRQAGPPSADAAEQP